MRVTYHHNWADHMYERCWLLWWGRFHSFNNYYDTGQYNTMTQTARGAQFRSDNDILENNGNTYPFFNYSEFATVFPPAGKIRVENPYIINNAPYEENDRLNVFNPAADYNYTPDPANETLRLKIMNNGGWQNVTPPLSLLSPPQNLHVLQ
jgi:pectate lyase